MSRSLPSGWTNNLTSNGGTINIPKNEETEDTTYRITVKAMYDGKELDSKTCDVTLKGKSNDCDFSDFPEAIEITVNGTFPECNNATRTWSGTAYLDSDSLETAQPACQDGNFIPSVGSIIAVLLPIPVLFLQFGLGPKFFVVLGLLTATEFIIGNLIEPRFLGEGMDLHPVAVVGSLIFWTLVWGVPGAFLSVPLTASLKIVLSQVNQTRVVAEILAGRLPH